MIRHFLKLVWRRKRANALVTVEILFSFLVVFAVVAVGTAMYAGWDRPVGFEWRDVWVVSVASSEAAPELNAPDDPVRQSVDRLLREVRNFPQVAAAAASDTPPYSGTTSSGVWHRQGKDVELTRDNVTDGFGEVLQIKPIRGRWFHPSDDALGFLPVVIDSDLARSFFGAQDALGQKIDETDGVEYRVVGIIPPYRKDGEFSAANVNMMFYRKSLSKPGGRVPSNILVRVRPGTPAAFEAELTRHLQAFEAGATIRVRRMEQMRDRMIRERIAPVIILGIIASFLIAMVCLGLTGVLWQTVTRRTRELGLRRALGASGGSVRSQVLIEVLMITTLAITVGVVLILQLPFLGIFRFIVPPVFVMAIVSALVVVYGMTLACGAYPSWLASRIEPAEALRYE